MNISSYVREISVIVIGIAIALLGDDLMQQYEREKISTELRVNLLEEVGEIEKYVSNRETVFKNDIQILDALVNNNIDFDSLVESKSNKSIYNMSIFGYRGFQTPNAFYKSLVNDGKIRYLESVGLKKELDLMHNINSYYIIENTKLEIVAGKKLKDYFEVNYPKNILDGYDEGVSINKYVYDLYTLIQTDDRMKAILLGKISQMEDKIIFLHRYKESLVKIKGCLTRSFK